MPLARSDGCTSSMMSSNDGPPSTVGSSVVPASPRCTITSSLASAWGTPSISPSRPADLYCSISRRSWDSSPSKAFFIQPVRLLAVNTSGCDIRYACRSARISLHHW